MPNNNRKMIDGLFSRTKIYLIVIAILLVALCIYDQKLIIPAIVVYAIIIAYTYHVITKRKAEISDHIHELIGDVDSAAKNSLINSPFPLVILETDGNIIWKSAKFVDEFVETDINSSLDEITREVKQEIINFNGKKQSIMKQVKIGKKTYKVLGEYVKSKKGKKDDEYMMTLYFLDNTENIELYTKYINSQTCIGIIMIDNYEEIMQRIDTENKPQIIAKLEKTIYEWAGLTNGLIIKTDRDTFIYVFEKRYLEQIESTKFAILDTIKEISADLKLQLTVSIAISEEGENNYEKYKSATAAIDIALGRGGDQAVIRENGKYIFFGGRTQEIEKRTKVKARTIAGALEELIKESSNVIIMGHQNGDIDSMGSSLGIYRLAKTLGKEANIVCANVGDALTGFVNALTEIEEYADVLINVETAKMRTGKDTVLVVCDTHKRNYVEAPELLEMTDKIVIIDHHRKSPEFIENPTLMFHEVYASSAAELVIELLQYASIEVKLTEIEVDALYGGIMVDTKNFTFKTGVRTFEAAAYLRKSGVDIIRIKKWFQSDLESYNVISNIVKNAEVINDSIGISTYDSHDKNANLICAKAADELLTINNITASFVLGYQGEKVCISRTLNR